MAARKPKQRLLDLLLDETLEVWLARRREEGATWREISLQIRDSYQLDVTEQTLRAYFASAPTVTVPTSAAGGA